MPKLGPPEQVARNSKFKNIAIKRPLPEKVREGINNKGKFLNDIAGVKEDRGIFVDGKKHNKLGKNEFLKLSFIEAAIFAASLF